MTLILEPVNVQGTSKWRWVLAEDSNQLEPLATFDVALDVKAREYAAFTDMSRYLRWHSAIDSQREDEMRIVADVAAWVRAQVFGHEICRLIENYSPCTIRVLIPTECSFILYYPLEIMCIGSSSAELRNDVTFVFDVLSSRRVPKGPQFIDGKLRVLAIFSMPTNTTALALRTERYKLTHMLREVALSQRLAIDLTVLQYGVTRRRLRETIQSGAGWDVLHLSGHGNAGEFLLEHPDGVHDQIFSRELVDMIRPSRNRLQLAFLSSCQSATATTAEALRWLDLNEDADEMDRIEEVTETSPTLSLSIAAEIAEALGCPVVGMRYRVADEFATNFALDFYRRVFARRQPIDLAMRGALASVNDTESGRSRLADCTPTLVGAGAIGLVFEPPSLLPQLDLLSLRMPGFPDEPKEFIGRTNELIQAGQALAVGCEKRGVLFTGMLGSGKSACALELTYRHRESFGVCAYWKASDESDSLSRSMTQLALSLEQQLRDYGFEMLQSIDHVPAFDRFLLRLRALLNDNSILIVLDNMEALVSDSGSWFDSRWAKLLSALLGHSGISRTIMTSRIRLPLNDHPSLLELPVGSLSRDETVLLAFQLPNLRRLAHPDYQEDAASVVNVVSDRLLLRRALNIVHGNPKLVELLNGAATDRTLLSGRVEAAEATPHPSLIEFLTTGVADTDPVRIARSISAWTMAIISSLPDEARLLAELLAWVEEPDRFSRLLEVVWPQYRQMIAINALGPDDMIGDLSEQLSLLAAHSIVKIQQAGGSEPNEVVMHPGVAESIRTNSSPIMGALVDDTMRQFYLFIHETSFKLEDAYQAKDYRRRAGISGFPYFARLGDWEVASRLLDSAISSDNSPAALQSILPAVREIAANDPSLYSQVLLAEVLVEVDPLDAEARLRDAFDSSLANRDESTVRKILQVIRPLYVRQGRLVEVREMLEAASATFSEQRIAVKAYNKLQSAQASFEVGSVREADDNAMSVLSELRAMDAEQVAEERKAGQEYDVAYDGALNLSMITAQTLGDFERSVFLGRELSALVRSSGGTKHRIATLDYNLILPLVYLGRMDEAENIADSCQGVFEEDGDIAQICRVFAGRSRIRRAQNRFQESVDLARQALRLAYVVGEMQLLCTFHGSLGEAEDSPYGDGRQELAQGVAGMAIAMAIDSSAVASGIYRQIVRSPRLAQLSEFSSAEELIQEAELVNGVRFREVLGRILSGTQWSPEMVVTEAIRHLVSDGSTSRQVRDKDRPLEEK